MNLVACSPERECFIVDSVKLVKMIETEGSNYFIYLRISGWHEKAASYELYKGRPTFGECRWPSISAISDTGVDPSEGIVSKLIIDKNLALIAVHVAGNDQKIDLIDVPVEVEMLTK